MQFRWVAFITVWTILSGPVFARPIPPREVASVRAMNAMPGGAQR